MTKVVVDGITYVPIKEIVLDNSVKTALELRFDSDVGDNITVREYLHKLLETLWLEGECFSSKRPFGNSDWEYDLYCPLVEGGFIDGDYHEDYGFEDLDRKEAKEFVRKLIHVAMFGED